MRARPSAFLWVNAIERWLNVAVSWGSALNVPATRYRRAMRIAFSILLLLMFLPSYSGEAKITVIPARIHMTAEPVDLDWRDPSRRRLGALTYLGGVHLASRARAFGGFSAMLVEGERFTLLSDAGNVVRFRMGRDWRVRDVTAMPLREGPGTGWRKLDRDSESLARDPATGRLWVGFEHRNQIWRYDATFRAQAHVAPAAMAKWPRASGPESMTRLRDGSFIVLAEGGEGPRAGLVFAGDPVRAPNRGFRFRYRAPDGYRPTDISELPDGRLAVLNRKASLREGFTVILTLVDRATIRPNQIVRGRSVARFAAPVVHDNFEAIAAVREGRDTILWIASDDNEYSFQRTLLLKFRLER